MIGDTSKATTREKRRIGKVINRPVEMLPYEKNGDSAIVFKADNYNDRELLIKELEYVDDKPFGYLIIQLDYQPTMSIDLAESAYNKIKLTGDLYIDNILNQSTGSDYMLIIEQDKVGGHSLSINDKNIQLYLKGVSMLSELDTSPNSLTYIKMTSVKGRLYGEVLNYSSFETKENQSYFSFDIEIANSGDTFTLPINTTSDADQYVQSFTADWGDDSTTNITSYDDTGATHTYNTPDIYTITMTGKSELFAVENTEDKDKIVKLNNFFGDIGFKKLNFKGCSNLTGNIPTSFKNLRNLVDCSNLFENCSSLIGKIPEDMFWNSYNIIDVSFAFFKSGIEGQIPEKLFWNNNKITNFTGTFAYALNITDSIPEKLFWYNPLVISFDSTFAEAKNLTGMIPEKLFWYNPEVINFHYTFGSQYSEMHLEGQIPEKLFWNNPKVQTFYLIFNNCTNLVGKIPEKLFWYNPEVKIFKGTFAGCSNLIGPIPEKLFWNNAKVTDFSYLFSKSSTTPIMQISGEIPERLFWNNPEITTFEEVFGNCENLTGDLPSNLFINNKKVTNYKEAFDGCNQLTGNGWRNIIEYATQYAEENSISLETDNCFLGCTSLTDYDQIPEEWK